MRLKFSFSILSIFIMVFFLSSCISLRAAFQSNLTMEQRFVIAYKDLNDNLEDYLAMYKIAPDETKEKWKKNIDPVFKEAKQALDAWETALGTAEVGNEEQAWIALKDQLLAALFQYGIIQME